MGNPTSSPDGGPAFPGEYVLHQRGSVGNEVPIMDHSSGMSLRDYFAGQALAGMLANPGRVGDFAKRAKLGEEAYYWADATLAKRDKAKP